MKKSALVSFAGSAALAACLAAAPLAGTASAQGGDAGRGDTGAPTSQQTRTERPFDWGWVGLLGLTGLLGLLPRRRVEREVHVRRDRTDSAGRPLGTP